MNILAHQMRTWLLAASLAVVTSAANAQVQGPVLSAPTVSGSTIAFTLTAEDGVTYAIQTSTNLADWVTVGTNSDPGIARAIIITNQPSADRCYCRAARGLLPLFGLAARGMIYIGGGISCDSFDSSDTNYSNADGSYNSSKAKDNAVVLTNTNVVNGISLNGSHIAGSVITGPGGTVATSAGATVGDFSWIAGNTGIEAGHGRSDANVQINDVAAPVFGTNSAGLAGGTVNGTNYTYLLGTGNYLVAGSMSVNGGQKMLVDGNAVFYCQNNLTVSGSGYIDIAPGASLTLYVGGTATISGGGVINENKNANTYYLYGLPTCRTVTYSGGSALYCVIDAPEADITFSGATGWVGAGIANSITVSGLGGIHFDESLARVGLAR